LRQPIETKNGDGLDDWFGWARDVEGDYLSQAQLKLYLDDWYRTVQKANEYMQSEQPWMKLKDPVKREE
jgi:methionyl-tRNA synthetase